MIKDKWLIKQYLFRSSKTSCLKVQIRKKDKLHYIKLVLEHYDKDKQAWTERTWLYKNEALALCNMLTTALTYLEQYEIPAIRAIEENSEFNMDTSYGLDPEENNTTKPGSAALRPDLFEDS